MTDRRTDRQTATLTDTRSDWRATLLVADITAVARQPDDTRLTWALPGRLAAITTQRSHQMTLAR